MSDVVEETASGTEPVPEDEDIAAMFDLKKKKKKKKKVVDEGEGADGSAVQQLAGTPQEFILDPPTYTYSDLLQRAVDLLHQHNPEYTEKRRQTMKPPQLMRGSSKHMSPHYHLTFNFVVIVT
jgi:hypothetical protein